MHLNLIVVDAPVVVADIGTTNHTTRALLAVLVAEATRLVVHAVPCSLTTKNPMVTLAIVQKNKVTLALKDSAHVAEQDAN